MIYCSLTLMTLLHILSTSQETIPYPTIESFDKEKRAKISLLLFKLSSRFKTRLKAGKIFSQGKIHV